MPVHIYSHPACLKHNPGPDKDFAPARLLSVIKALKNNSSLDLIWHEAAEISCDALHMIHTPDYIQSVLAPIEEGQEKAFDFETYATSGTASALLRASGLAFQAAQDVCEGRALNAFCLVSPGGHHAEADMALGYCFFNHVALAAIAAQKLFHMPRIALLDFDAHHGNGTQSFFWNDENRLYISLHKDNPLSGFAHETGAWDNIMNIPLPASCPSAPFRRAMQEKALPKLRAFRPDILFVSAGFDMHKDDPLGEMGLETEDYDWLGQQLGQTANDLCHGRLVALLEGGYNLNALAQSAEAFVRGLGKT